MSERIPVAVWQGDVVIMGIKLRMAVLDDGRRIIDEESMCEFLNALADPNSPSPTKEEALEMVKFIRENGGTEYRVSPNEEPPIAQRT